MKIAKSILVLLSLLLAFTSTAAAQSYQESMEDSTRKFNESTEAMADFVKDVTFDEDDIKSMITNWDELNDLGKEKRMPGKDGEDMVDFEALLAYPAYRSWANSRGLDPDVWVRKFMRIQVMLMQETLAAGSAESSGQFAAQLAELEKQRAQMGEAMYQQMKQAMEMSAAAMGSISKASRDLPKPTASEKALLEVYRDEIMNLR